MAKKKRKAKPRSVLQAWVTYLPLMQQTVLLTAIRGPDGVRKEHPAKAVLRWFRRCVLLSAMDKKILRTPDVEGGGSFTGPVSDLAAAASEYLSNLDDVPHHFHLHLVHAAQIVGYKHPDKLTREWWRILYFWLVSDLHLEPESEEQMDTRLSDSFNDWAASSLRAMRMERDYQAARTKKGEAISYDGSLRWPRVPNDVVETIKVAGKKIAEIIHDKTP